MSGPRRWPADRVLRQLQKACGLPEGATVERRKGPAGLSYRDNGLLRRLLIAPQKSTSGVLDWQVLVCAEAAQPPSSGLCAEYAPAQGLVFPAGEEPRRSFRGYAWPVTGGELDPDLIRDIGRFAAPMLWFLADARDLGALMLHGGTGVTRGDVSGQVIGALAARVTGP